MAAVTNSSSPLKGKKRGLRLLSLDGGGIRGFSELCILEKLMLCLQNETFQGGEIPKPCDIFDMICGTSTGGLIAIMLGRLRMSINECFNAYAKFAEEVFGDPNPSWKLQDGKYKASKLENVIKEIVRAQDQGETMLDTRPGSCKVFVCATPAATVNRARRLRTYDPSTIGQCAIWEAARATSAAPYFFEAAEISFRPGVTERFVDGALGYNNPVLELYSEAKDTFTSQDIDCIISIGTGSARYGSLPRPKIWETKIPTNIIDALKTIALSCERSHEQMLELFRNNPDVYFRFSVDASPEKIGLDEWKRLGEVQTRTIDYMEKPDVRRLTAVAAKSLHGTSHSSAEIPNVPNLDELSLREIAEPRHQGSEVELRIPREGQILEPAQEHSKASDKALIRDQRMDMFLHKLDVDKSSIYGVRKEKAVRYEGTCEWINQKDEYTEWRRECGPRILLIVAPPGQGKSTLAKYLLEGIRSDAADSPDRIVLEYFCHDSHGRNTANVVLRSMLYQLLANRPHLFEFVYHKNSELDERDTELTSDGLWEILVAVLESPRIKSVICLIDGLDECEDVSQGLLWKLIETEFVHKTLSNSDVRRKFRILLTSRPIALARQIGLLTHELEIRREDVDPDITRYIEHRVDRMTSARLIPSDVSEVVTELLGTGAGGMFLWVSLSLDQLEDFEESLSFYDILDILRSVPRDIKGLYRRALERIHKNENFRERSRKIFEILLIAGDSLNVEAFALAMTRWPETCTTHSELQQRSDIRFEYTSKRVCGSMIRIVDNTIQLCHPSARQYLLSDAIGHGLFSFDETTCHVQLAQLCLKYLLLDDLDMESANVEADIKKFPLLKYAITYWPLHLRSSKDAIWSYSTLIRRFLSSSNLNRLHDSVGVLKNFKETFYGAEYETHLIHYLAFHDLSNVLRAVKFLSHTQGVAKAPSKSTDALLEVKINVDARSLMDSTALMTAALYASLSTVQILLEQGADADAMNDHRDTALHRAACGTNVSIVRELIGRTSDIDCRNMLGMTPLLCATDIRIVSALLDGGAEIDGRRNDGKSSLHLAAQEGNYSLFETLLKRGAAFDTVSDDGSTPLYAAVVDGNIPISKLLLEKKPVVRTEEDHGWNPLHAAAFNGSTEAVSLLLDYGIDPDIDAKSLRTPLFMAAMNGHVKVTDLLLKAGAKVNHLNIHGEMAIHSAAGSGQEKSIFQLISAGSPINVMSKLDQTPLRLACLGRHLQTVKLLLENGAVENFTTMSQIPILQRTILDGFQDIAESLIMSGVELESTFKSSWTPLYTAVWKDDMRLVKVLLQKGARVDCCGPDGKSLLHLSAYWGRKDLVIQLLELGLDVNALSLLGRTALHEAAESGHLSVSEELENSGAMLDIRTEKGLTPFLIACAAGHIGLVRWYYEKGSNPNDCDRRGCNSMDLAAMKGRLNVIEFLLAESMKNCDPTAYWHFPVHHAAASGHLEVLHRLLREEPNLNRMDDNGQTALWLAARHNHVQVSDLLIQRGAEVIIASKQNTTVLHNAAYHGRLNLVQYCLSKGSSPLHLSTTNESPLTLAIKENHIDIVKNFLTYSKNIFKDKSIFVKIRDSTKWMENMDMITLLLGAGFDPKASDSRGESALFKAVCVGNRCAVKLFLEMGVDPAKANQMGDTPLHMAAASGRNDILALLVANEVPISPRSKSGDTPLHEASFNRRYGCIEQLMQAGASPLIENQSGLSAMDLAAASPFLFMKMATWREHYVLKSSKSRLAGVIAAIKVIYRHLATTSSEKSHERFYSRNLLTRNLFWAGEYDLYRVAILLGQAREPHPDFDMFFVCDMCDKQIDINQELLRRCKTCAWDICKACMSRYDKKRTADDRLCSDHKFLSIDAQEWHEIDPVFGKEPEKETIVRERWMAEMQQKFGDE